MAERICTACGEATTGMLHGGEGKVLAMCEECYHGTEDATLERAVARAQAAERTIERVREWAEKLGDGQAAERTIERVREWAEKLGDGQPQMAYTNVLSRELLSLLSNPSEEAGEARADKCPTCGAKL